jgi:hypothetical protein
MLRKKTLTALTAGAVLVVSLATSVSYGQTVTVLYDAGAGPATDPLLLPGWSALTANGDGPSLNGMASTTTDSNAAWSFGDALVGGGQADSLAYDFTADQVTDMNNFGFTVDVEIESLSTGGFVSFGYNGSVFNQTGPDRSGFTPGDSGGITETISWTYALGDPNVTNSNGGGVGDTSTYWSGDNARLHLADNTAGSDLMSFKLVGATLTIEEDPGARIFTIDRDTGEISLDNTSAVATSNIIGYSLLSTAGSLDQSNWNQQNVSSQLANDDDDWTVLTGSGVTTDLSEAVLTTTGIGDGGDLVATTGTWTFGNVWTKTPFEDIGIELLLDDGTVLNSAGSDFRVEYAGTAALSGDIAGATVGDGPDGDINLVDWEKFKASINTDVSAETAAGAYLGGDLTGDLLVNHLDYNAFVAAFDAANPISFAQAIAGVPEPSSVALIVLGMGLAFGTRSRKRQSMALHSELPVIRESKRGTMKMANNLGAVLVALFLLCSNSALAVSDFVLVSYDADAGNPANAAAIQSPEDQGWFEWASTVQGQDPNLAVQEGVIGNDSTNAWLNDDQEGNTNPGYGIAVDPSAQQAMFDFGFEYQAVITMTRGGHFSAYGVGDGNPWGLPSGARVGFAPSVDANNAIVINPVDNDSTANIVAPNDTVGDFYKVVIANSPQAATGSVTVTDFSDSTLVGTENYTGWTSSGTANNIDILGIQSGSSGGDNRTAQIHSLNFVVAAPDTLTLKVNTTNGSTQLINNSSSAVNFNGYFLESDGGQLSTGGWNSLESIDQDGNGVPDDGIGWEEFDNTDSSYLAEGFLTDSTTLGPGASLSLGTAYNPAIAGVDVDGDLSFRLTDAAGRTVPSSLFSTIEYVISGIAGDYDDSGAVGQGDLNLVLQNWGDTAPPVPAGWINEQPDGLIGQTNLNGVLQNWGNTSAVASVGAVPEPSTGLMLLVGGMLTGVCLRSSRRRGEQVVDCSISERRASRGRSAARLAPLAAALLLAGTANATENDRDYTLGDDSGETSSANATVGAQTFDSAGNLGAGDLQDLNTSGDPVYRAVDGGSGRPGADSGDLGIEFDGTDDVLYTPISMNAPTQMWDNSTFFPGPPPQIFPHNYEGIFAHGIQLWAKPTVTGAQQDLIFDSLENGIGITADDTWGLGFDNPAAGLLDSEVTVASTLDSNGWVHAMQLAGFDDPAGGGSAEFGALLVNGVAVRAAGGFYDPSTTPLSIGGAVELDGTGSFVSSSNHYTGQLDDVRVFFWGDNSDELGDDGVAGGSNNGVGDLNADGQDWLPLNLAVDNDWIAQELGDLGVTDPADVNLSGGAADAADEAAFLTHWRKQQLINNVQVGDWNSRQEGDLNYDGIVNLADAFILHEGLQAAGLSGFNFTLLGAVPEPTSVALALIGFTALGAVRRRRST